MSIHALILAMEAPVTPPPKKLALVFLADWGADDGLQCLEAPLDVPRLARSVGVAVPEAERIVGDLAAAGLLCIAPRRMGSAEARTFWLDLQRLEALSQRAGVIQ